MCHSLGSPTGTGTKQNYLLLSWFCGVQDNQDHSNGKKKRQKEKCILSSLLEVCI